MFKRDEKRLFLKIRNKERQRLIAEGYVPTTNNVIYDPGLGLKARPRPFRSLVADTLPAVITLLCYLASGLIVRCPRPPS